MGGGGPIPDNQICFFPGPLSPEAIQGLVDSVVEERLHAQGCSEEATRAALHRDRPDRTEDSLCSQPPQRHHDQLWWVPIVCAIVLLSLMALGLLLGRRLWEWGCPPDAEVRRDPQRKAFWWVQRFYQKRAGRKGKILRRNPGDFLVA